MASRSRAPPWPGAWSAVGCPRSRRSPAALAPLIVEQADDHAPMLIEHAGKLVPEHRADAHLGAGARVASVDVDGQGRVHGVGARATRQNGFAALQDSGKFIGGEARVQTLRAAECSHQEVSAADGTRSDDPAPGDKLT